jgi:hypothetical protein
LSLIQSVSLLIVCGCATAVHTPAPAPSPGVDTEKITATTAPQLWSPHLSPALRNYSIYDTSTITLTNDSTKSHIAPIETTTILSLDVRRTGSGLVAQAKIDSLSSSNSRAGDSSKVSMFEAPVSPDGRLVIPGLQQAQCGNAQASVSNRLSELISSYPAGEIQPGAKWLDTVSTTTCHGKTPLIQEVVRQYELVGNSETLENAVTVRRETFMNFHGSSVQQNGHLDVEGSGTGSGVLTIDRATGLLLEGATQSKAKMNVRTSRGIFPFTQIVVTHIVSR